MMRLLLVTLAGVVASVSACNHMGSCPNPPLQEDFDVKQYMGKWFEYVKFPVSFEQGARCVTANYTLNPDGSVIVLNGAIQEQSFGFGICPWYTSNVAKGEATVDDPSEPARLSVRFSPNRPPGPYTVLETDYVTYALVYSCSYYMQGVPIYSESCWVLTRDRGVAPPGLSQIYTRLREYGIDPSKFEMADQKGCPVWP